MTKSKLDIRPATIEDIRERYDVPMPSMRAWIGHVGEERAGIWGLMHTQGRWVLFFDIEEPLRPFKVTMVKESIKTMEVAREMGIKKVYSAWDEDEPMGEKWMFRLGFHKEKHYYVWKDD